MKAEVSDVILHLKEMGFLVKILWIYVGSWKVGIIV